MDGFFISKFHSERAKLERENRWPYQVLDSLGVVAA